MSNSVKVVEKFKHSVQENLDFHHEFLLAIHNKTRQNSLESQLVEQFTMSLGVTWESFLSELLIAYIIRNPKKCLDTIKSSINQSLADRYGKSVAKKCTFTRPKKLNEFQALALIDPKGFNVTANSADNLTKLANKYLVGHFAKKFTLDPEDREVIDLVISIRNYIAHKSKGSRQILKRAIEAIVNNKNKPLRAEMTQIGPYLRSKISGTDSRATFIAKRLLSISDKLK